MSIYDSLTNLYSLSKTLRFELKPVPETENIISQAGFFEKDKKRKKYYEDLKVILDEYHREYIGNTLKSIHELPITGEMLDTIVSGEKHQQTDIFKLLRKKLASYFTNKSQLSSAQLIKKIKQDWENEDYEKIAELFYRFNGYVKSYDQNRKNLYKSEDKAGQIAFRLIDENLARFAQGVAITKKILEKYPGFVIQKSKPWSQVQEEKLLKKYASHFLPGSYVHYITQEGIDTYNDLVGDINIALNQHKQQSKQKLGRIPVLYKLPLAPKTTRDWIPKQLEDIQEVYVLVQEVIVRMKNDVIPFLKDVFSYDLEGVYVKKKALEYWGTNIGKGWQSFLGLVNRSNASPSNKNPKSTFISLEQIKEFFREQQKANVDLTSLLKNIDTKFENDFDLAFQHSLLQYWQSLIHDFQQAAQVYEEFQGDPSKDSIKQTLDHALKLWKELNNFQLKYNKKSVHIADRDTSFYEWETGLEGVLYSEEYSVPVHVAYDKIRNFFTKKPEDSVEKIKLNFDNPSLADGWDQNKESDNTCVLLKKEWLYYLAIMNPGHKHFFDKKKNPDIFAGRWYQKMVYKLLPGPNKMLPKVIFSKKRKDTFPITKDILRIKEEGTFKVWKKFSLRDLHTLIDFFKQCIAMYSGRQEYEFDFLPTEQYQKINEFYHDIERSWYKTWWVDVDEALLYKAAQEGKIYLFTLFNKDFKKNSTGKPNLHTMYFHALFDKKLYKINGEAEVFMRPRLIQEKKYKKDENGNYILTPTWNKVIEYKRYTKRKYMFHLPITLNFCRTENKYNARICQLIQSKKTWFTVLGIDRGEKHLLYYSLIDQDGKIIETWSWNTIVSWPKKVNYHQKLEKREGDRRWAQLHWDQQGQIKDLKEWYVSHIVHRICKMVIDHNAIIVLENLNTWFKRRRQKIEKNVYQQFELALTKKLNYLVFKNRLPDSPGGVHKAYQLTPPVSNFQDLKRQTWIVRYVNPAYTSTTCPTCGWRKTISLRYKNIPTAKEDLSKFQVKRNANMWYNITYYYTPRDSRIDISTANQQRFRYDRSSKEIQNYKVTRLLDEVLGRMQWEVWLEQASSSDLKKVMRIINLLLSIRNSKDDQDYVSCPYCGFHSNNGFQSHSFNGDANGAYHIARKGAMIIKKVAEGDTKVFPSLQEYDALWQVTDIEM